MLVSMKGVEGILPALGHFTDYSKWELIVPLSHFLIKCEVWSTFPSFSAHISIVWLARSHDNAVETESVLTVSCLGRIN